MRSLASFATLSGSASASQHSSDAGQEKEKLSNASKQSAEAESSEADSNSKPSSLRHLGDFLAREIQQGRLLLQPYIDEASIVAKSQNFKLENAEKRGKEEGARHVEYSLKYDLRLVTEEAEWEYKRYSRFRELHEKLKAKFPHVQLPKLPQRRWLKFSRRSFDPEYIGRKSEDLSHFLQALAQIEGVNTSKEFLRFVLGQRFEDFLHESGKELKHVDSYSSSASIPQSLCDLDPKYSLGTGAADSAIGMQLKNTRKTFLSPSENETKLPLFKQKSCSEESHPFVSKLIDKEKHKVSVDGNYNDAEDLLSAKCLILTLCEAPLVDVQLTIHPVSFAPVVESSVLFHGEAVIDGHALAVSGSLSIQSLEGSMTLDSLETHTD